MKYNIILLSLVCITLTSCFDEMMMENKILSSNIKFRVLDNNDNPIKNAKVFINPHDDTNYYTDGNGELNVSLNEGSYTVIISAFKNKFYYISTKTFLVIYGTEPTYEFKPYKNICNYTIQVLGSYKEFKPIKDINVALLPDNVDYPNDSSFFDDLINSIMVEGKTDENGIVTFKDIPTSYWFHILAYYDKDKYYFYNLSFPADEGKAESFNEIYFLK